MSTPSGLMAEGNSPPESDTDISLALGSLETGMDIHAFRRVRMAISAWLTEARASAEPRLRPASEKPQIGDLIVHKFGDGSFGSPFRYHEYSSMKVVAGWVLLERAKPKTLAEEARQLVNDAGSAFDPNAWGGRATALLRRVAEQEKRDE